MFLLFYFVNDKALGNSRLILGRLTDSKTTVRELDIQCLVEAGRRKGQDIPMGELLWVHHLLL